jgi:hypothetical protein
MTNANASRIRQIISRVTRVWSELDYAQRRVFEIRTGIPTGAGESRRAGGRPKISRSVEELERLYAA